MYRATREKKKTAILQELCWSHNDMSLLWAQLAYDSLRFDSGLRGACFRLEDSRVLTHVFSHCHPVLWRLFSANVGASEVVSRPFVCPSLLEHFSSDSDMELSRVCLSLSLLPHLPDARE